MFSFLAKWGLILWIELGRSVPCALFCIMSMALYKVPEEFCRGMAKKGAQKIALLKIFDVVFIEFCFSKIGFLMVVKMLVNL